MAWAAYGALGCVKSRLAAIAQLPLPLAAAATVSGTGPVALALAVTAGGDLILTAWAVRRRLAAERRAGCLTAATTWAGAVVIAVGEATAAHASGIRWPAAVFMLAGVVGVLGARMRWMPWVLAGLITGLCGGLVAIGPALLVAPELPVGWQVAAFAGCGTVVATAVWWGWPLTRPAGVTAHGGDATSGSAAVPAPDDGSPVGGDSALPQRDPVARNAGGASAGPAVRSLAGHLAAGGAAVLGAAGLMVTPDAFSGLWYPLPWVGRAWTGPAVTAQVGRAPWLIWDGRPATPAVLALAGLACWLWPVAWRPTVRAGARSKAWSAAVGVTALAVGPVPVVVGMPGWAALVTHCAGGGPARRGDPSWPTVALAPPR